MTWKCKKCGSLEIEINYNEEYDIEDENMDEEDEFIFTCCNCENSSTNPKDIAEWVEDE